MGIEIHTLRDYTLKQNPRSYTAYTPKAQSTVKLKSCIEQDDQQLTFPPEPKSRKTSNH